MQKLIWKVETQKIKILNIYVYIYLINKINKSQL